jgi:hypothetical protein
LEHFLAERTFVSTLKHIYHYYIHGFYGNVERTPVEEEKK